MSWYMGKAGPSLITMSLILGSVLCLPAAGQQPQPWVGSISDPAQFAKAQSLADTLNDEAGANDSAGIHRYCEHLVKLLVPPRAGQKYIRSLADRLARAEEAARRGGASLVPETRVVEAYNDLMKNVGAPASLLTNETAVRNLRHIGLDKSSGALITVGRNGGNCNPGEAMYLLLALFWNNGGPRASLESTAGPTRQGGAPPGPSASLTTTTRLAPSAGRSLQAYSAAHRPRDTRALFKAVAGAMGL